MGWRARKGAQLSAIMREKERQDEQLAEGNTEEALGFKGCQPCDGTPRPTIWRSDRGRVWVFDN